MSSISPYEFDRVMTSLLNKYAKDVVEKTVEEKVEEIGKEAKIVVKGYSKPKDQLYITGDYQKGWGTTFRRKKGVKKITVYNRNKPTLVHLLEFGHKIAGTNRKTRAFPHVSPTEIAYTKKLYEELRKELQ